MITNERQLNISKAQAKRFEASLEALEAGSLETADLHPKIKQAQIDAVRGQLLTLLDEIREYELLKSGQISTLELDSLAELPDGLIRARIAAGLTQKELADRLKLKEQQIQRYEASRYEGASFLRIVEIAEAIGITVKKEMHLPIQASLSGLLSRLGKIGIDKSFIKRRIAPDLDLVDRNLDALTTRIAMIFGWDPSTLSSNGTFDLSSPAGGQARFKMPRGRNAKSVAMYTRYAYRLAEICAGAVVERDQALISDDWKQTRSSLLETYGSIEFASACNFVWDLGHVVLPLNDPGAFHGACWRIQSVNVVVLKQAHRYPARWLFDLLHEVRHAAEEPDKDQFEVIEEPETSEKRRSSESERRASWFAGQILLNGRSEELVEECIERAGGDLRRLKRAAIAVASKHDESISQLANYIAFRLSLQGENWWGVAANLQDKSFDPLSRARDIFFERFPFDALRESEQQALSMALSDEVDHE